MSSSKVSIRYISAHLIILVLACFLQHSFAAAPDGSDEKAKSNAKVKIAIVGDSIADGLWSGAVSLISKNKCLKDRVELGRFGKVSTGLARSDKFDWVEHTSKIAETFKPQLMLVAIGLNDGQQVVEKGENGKFRISPFETPQWSDAYRRVVNAMLNAALTHNMRIFWLGLPSMREKAVNSHAQKKNGIYAETIAQIGSPNVKYLPPWRLKTDGDEVFASYGPDNHGRMINIRATDGMHFTLEGYELVAKYAFQKMNENLADSGIDLNGSCQLVSE